MTRGSTERVVRKHRISKRVRNTAIAVAAGLSMTVATAACTAGTAESGNTGGGTSQSGDSSKYLNFFPCCSWGTTWSYNPYNVNGLGIQNNYISMSLAAQMYPSLTEYTPQLADKWTVEGKKLAVHLRDDAKWDDGKPVTSKDLYDTLILDGTRGDGFWNDITDAKITDDHTVTFTVAKDQPMSLAQGAILGIVVYPSSVYGKFVTDDVAQDVKSFFRVNQKDPDKAAKLTEADRIGNTFKKLAAYKVDKLIGDGPFKMINITTKQAKLDKSDTFWGADKIKFGGINFFNGENQAIYPQLLSGNIDLSTVYMPPPILKQWNNVQDSHVAVPPSFGYVMGFNSSKYPFNIKEVRQALAYVIPREQMTEAAFGSTKSGGGLWKEIDTGISPTMEKLYLTPDQLDQLNKYPVDPDKASELLKSKGFTKKGNQWMMPNGKPFTATFIVNSATSNQVTSLTSAAKALTAFGVNADVNATSGAQQDADQHNGDFEIGSYSPNSNSPLGMYDAMMGSGQNFSSSGTYADKRGLGFGPKMDVPGLGNVNIPRTLDEQSRTVPPGQKMKDYTWDWAQLVNDQVPYIWYATKNYQYEYSTKNFDNWPPVDKNGTSPLWDLTGFNMSLGFSLAMQQGYITPKS